MKPRGGVELLFHSFLTPALEGGEWLASPAVERAFRTVALRGGGGGGGGDIPC
jgi:hypothetical protein